MIEKIENEENNLQTTENGAVGYSSTGKDLVDLNFQVPSMRVELTDGVIEKFTNALHSNLIDTVKWMFFLRDVREGVGERNSFVKLYSIFNREFPAEAQALIPVVAEYGRWKDVVDIAFSEPVSNSLKTRCFAVLESQLISDASGLMVGDSISLLAKWMPSINASKKSRSRALEFIKYTGMTNTEYRKMLSKLRAHLDVTERKTCAGKWGEIDYNKVSSNANLRYAEAFIRHDSERRREYLQSLLSDDKPANVKMNAGDLYPHEIWHKYHTYNSWSFNPREYDASLEAMWQNLKDMGAAGNTMCVCDGSGSMESSIPGSGVWAIDVSRALSVYFAERCNGEFKNRFIEFSNKPSFIDLNGCQTLRDKIAVVNKYNSCQNTNIEKVFDLILRTAVEENMTQADLPERILIISDMEFDSGVDFIREGRYGHYERMRDDDFKQTLFGSIKERYEAAGFKMPRLVFWNVNSRTNTIPITENELGVTLISGYSVNLLKLVLSNSTDPWTVLKEILDSERYAKIGEILSMA